MQAVDIQNLTTAEKWDYVYRFFGAKDYMDFLSSTELQSRLLPAKIVFILFALFFLCAVIYFYINSSYLRYQFMQDVTEFFSWQSYGLIGINKRWKKIIKKTESGGEPEYKLAIVEVDDFLFQVLEERGYEGGTFEDLVNSVGKKMLPNYEDILSAHDIRNSIVYDVNYKLDLEKAKNLLAEYEKAIKNMAT